MKTKPLVLSLAVLLGLGALWLGRAAWRAHRQLVTLNVHEMPLPRVLRSLERQTWASICAEQSLNDVRITLHVTDQPLRFVLDRIAEQAGAHWSTVFAVYGSAGALRSLELALGGDGKLKPARWSQLAPTMPQRPPPPPPDSSPPAGKGGPMVFGRMLRGKGGGQVVFSAGANGQTEVWSPKELLMESALVPRLDGERDQTATAASAAATARQVKARWTAFYALTKSAMGVGMMQPPGGNLVGPGPGHGFPSLGALEHQQYDRFTRLTPEQRVEQARQRRDHPPMRHQFRGFRLPED